jgi:hypothetical protein
MKHLLAKISAPSASKIWLLLLAGLMWSAVGLMLSSLAYQWLSDLHSIWSLVIGFGSLAFGAIVYRFGFSHIAQQNISRLQAILDKACVFGFMPWKSYLMVGGMMTLGIVLRSSPLPKAYLAIVYITIGAALFLSSLQYYPLVWRGLRPAAVKA